MTNNINTVVPSPAPGSNYNLTTDLSTMATKISDTFKQIDLELDKRYKSGDNVTFSSINCTSSTSKVSSSLTISQSSGSTTANNLVIKNDPTSFGFSKGTVGLLYNSSTSKWVTGAQIQSGYPAVNADVATVQWVSDWMGGYVLPHRPEMYFGIWPHISEGHGSQMYIPAGGVELQFIDLALWGCPPRPAKFVGLTVLNASSNVIVSNGPNKPEDAYIEMRITNLGPVADYIRIMWMVVL